MAGRRRVSVVGWIVIVGFALTALAGFIFYTSAKSAPRECRGSGVTSRSAPSPEDAIAEYADDTSVAPWLGIGSAIPADRWVRRNDHVYEHSADADRVVQVDVGENNGQWTVVGFWVCTP